MPLSNPAILSQFVETIISGDSNFRVAQVNNPLLQNLLNEMNEQKREIKHSRFSFVTPSTHSKFKEVYDTQIDSRLDGLPIKSEMLKGASSILYSDEYSLVGLTHRQGNTSNNSQLLCFINNFTNCIYYLRESLNRVEAGSETHFNRLLCVDTTLPNYSLESFLNMMLD